MRRRILSRRSGISTVSFVVHSPPPQLLVGHLCQMFQRGWNTDLSHTSQITIWEGRSGEGLEQEDLEAQKNSIGADGRVGSYSA